MDVGLASAVEVFNTIPRDILDDLSSRFIINIPEEERKDVIRICFQIELAHWFYLDFYCHEKPYLKQCGMKEFAKLIFNHIPSLKSHSNEAQVSKVLSEFREYKMAVPTYGAIILDESLEFVLLVQGYYAKSSWGFPKGKVNKEEEPYNCAVREVLEETGFNIGQLIKKDEYIECQINELQLVRLYIVCGVSKSTHFIPKTRNEIKSLEWFAVADLPAHKKEPMKIQGLGHNSFFMVMPFVKQLRKWIASKQQKNAQSATGKITRSKTVGDTSTSSLPTAEKPKKVQYMEFKSSVYSPPPRMLKLKAQQDGGKNVGKQQQTKDDSSKRTAPAEQPKPKGEFEFVPSSWVDFKFDIKAIMDAIDTSLPAGNWKLETVTTTQIVNARHSLQKIQEHQEDRKHVQIFFGNPVP